MDTIIPSVISIVGVLISVSVSVFVTRQQYKIELEKIKRQLEQQYAKSLFDKRVEIYPKLYNLLSGYRKTILYKKQNTKNLLKFRDEVDQWNNQYSFFFTGSTGRLSGNFRGYLNKVLAKGVQSKIQDSDWDAIQKILRSFETSLRSEIGVTSIEPASNIEGIEKIYEFIEKRTQEKENS